MAKKSSTQQTKPRDFADICRIWALSDHWPLEDAVSLVLRQPPRLLANGKMIPKLKQQHDELREIALNCAGDSLPFLNSRGLPDQHRVRPRDFLEWASKIIKKVPEELKSALDEADSKLGRSNTPRDFTPTQRRRERCRGIAALLWDQYPTLTKRQMAQRPEILTYGCEDETYVPDTIEDWIKIENPNKKGGRPKES